MFQRVVETAKQLYDEEFDQEGLEFFANFLTINLDFVPREFFEPVFELLITRYTTNEELVTLMKVSLDAGISILKKYGKDEWELLLKILECGQLLRFMIPVQLWVQQLLLVKNL